MWYYIIPILTAGVIYYYNYNNTITNNDNTEIVKKLMLNTTNADKIKLLLKYKCLIGHSLFLVNEHKRSFTDKSLITILDFVNLQFKGKLLTHLLDLENLGLNYQKYITSSDDVCIVNYLNYQIDLLRKVIDIYESNLQMSLENIYKCIEILSN